MENMNSSTNIGFFRKAFSRWSTFLRDFNKGLTTTCHEFEAFMLALECTPCVLIYRQTVGGEVQNERKITYKTAPTKRSC